MADTEVETILREIRERVLAEQQERERAAARPASLTNVGNGAGDPHEVAASGPENDSETGAQQHLSLINSYLTTTARAWDRLPPLVSNRSGFIARVELWLKGHLKRATRWYAWEQVNFNAAVHHALRDMVPILSAHEEEIRQLRAQADSRSQELERYQESLTSQLTHLQSELAALRSLGEAQKQQTQLQLSSLATELRERDEHLLEEQRVCFKQLSLETSEAAILEDRARRKAETVLEDLQRRIEQFEKGKK